MTTFQIIGIAIIFFGMTFGFIGQLIIFRNDEKYINDLREKHGLPRN